MTQSEYDLNGADTLSACLWFLKRERSRHMLDIARIEIDIDALIRAGAKMPDTSVDLFFKIPGVDYGKGGK